MLRGVNKNIIEIYKTEDKYIEKAILFLREDKKERDSLFLKSKADEFLNKLDLSTSKWDRIKYKRISNLIYMLLSAATGAVITALVFLLI